MVVEQKLGLNRESKDPAVLGERLELTYSSRLDFAHALELATDEIDLLIIAQAQAEVGIDSSPLLEGISIEDMPRSLKSVYLPETDSPYPDRRGNICRRIAQVYAALGNLNAADEALKRGKEYSHPIKPDVYLYIAQASHQHGFDASSYLETAKSLAGRRLMAGGRVKLIPWFQIEDYGKLAQTYYQVDRDPKPVLTEAEGIVSAVDQLDRNECFGELAKAYGRSGYFADALRLADQIEEYGRWKPSLMRDIKKEALAFIASQQMVEGEIQSGLQTVLKTQDHFLIAQFFAEAAILGQEKADFSSLAITLAKEHGEQIQKDEEKAVILAIIGRVEEGRGEDSKDSLSLALEKASDRIGALLEIGRNQALSGLETEARNTFALAFKYTEGIVEPDDDSGYAIAEQHMAWEDLASTAIAVGYYDLAREIIAQLQFNDSKVEFLTKLAKAQAQKGLSPEEIAGLSEADIKAIRISNQPLAEEALRYFGFPE